MREGGTERERQPVFQAWCHADTSLSGTVTFGLLLLPFYTECCIRKSFERIGVGDRDACADVSICICVGKEVQDPSELMIQVYFLYFISTGSLVNISCLVMETSVDVKM